VSSTTLGQKIKGALIMGALGFVVLVSLPYLGFGFDTSIEETPFGPRKPGFNEKVKCQYVSLDVEMSLTDTQRERGLTEMSGILNAELGTLAGSITNQKITVPDYGRTRAYFKQEFCARKGDVLSAVVTVKEFVNGLDCYFYIGPDADADNINFEWRKNTIDVNMTWCRGVVP
jgi:hypothetical protein